jgi:hypothetical protein
LSTTEKKKYFYGKVLGMTKDLILYEGDTIEEIFNDLNKQKQKRHSI